MGSTEAKSLSTAQWWGWRLLRYNFSITAAGVVAFGLYVALVWSFPERLPEAEVTAFTIAFQAAGFAVALVVANVCYLLGPALEVLLTLKDPGSYRRVAYGLGLGFSLLLIFSPIALLIYSVFVGV